MNVSCVWEQYRLQEDTLVVDKHGSIQYDGDHSNKHSCDRPRVDSDYQETSTLPLSLRLVVEHK